jgi:hypothetical protein
MNALVVGVDGFVLAGIALISSLRDPFECPLQRLVRLSSKRLGCASGIHEPIERQPRSTPHGQWFGTAFYLIADSIRIGGAT